ncbi:MAG: efflux RND transporter periplasmic adaptor subunit [Neomegalonema sp.]|nr:efflux RND transporter periplasmic adaptor subunit [Neomegalonema sp.]
MVTNLWTRRAAVLAIGAGAITLGALSSLSSAQQKAKAPTLRPVKLVQLTADAEWPVRRFFGRVVARKTVDLAFQVTGQIVKFPVSEGDRLKKGAVLAQLDLEPYRLAYESAQLRREQSDRAYKRLAKLGPRTTSQASIDDAKTAFDLAVVAEREAKRNLDKATLHAPFQALVAERRVDAFTTVSAGQAVIRLHDMSEVRVQIEVPEVLFRQASGAQDFDISATLVGDTASYKLEAREFKAETSRVGQTFVITLAFADTPSERLLPGATVTVTTAPKAKASTLYLPPSALIFSPDRKPSVLVFQPDKAASSDATGEVGVVKKVDVQIDANHHGRIKVLSGVKVGDRIVAAGAPDLTDGAQVRVYKGLNK